MPTTAEILAGAEKAVADRDVAQAELKALKAKMASTPDYSGVHKDDDGRVVGEWEEGDESVEIVSGRDDLQGPRATRQSSRRAIMKSLRKTGYVPAGQNAEFKSVNEWIRSGLDGHETPEFRDRQRNHFKALKTVQGMSDGIGSDGGFTVFPEFNTKIFERVYSNDLVGSTDNYAVGGNNMTFLANAETSRVDGSRHGGLRGYWTGEGQTITSSKPTVRNVNIKLQKAAVTVYLTDELIADTSVALEQYVTRKASEEFNFLIGAAIFGGDGVGKPLGVLNAPSLLAITAEIGQATKTVQTENIAKMYARFFAPFVGNAKWYHNQDVQQSLPLMTLGIGAAGVATYMPDGGMASKPNQMLMGLPTQPIEFAKTLGTQGDLVLADLGQILSINKGGVNQAVSMHVEFLTDQIALRFTMRMNAMPWENAPTTPYQGSNTQSSFVALATR